MSFPVLSLEVLSTCGSKGHCTNVDPPAKRQSLHVKKERKLQGKVCSRRGCAVTSWGRGVSTARAASRAGHHCEQAPDCRPSIPWLSHRAWQSVCGEQLYCESIILLWASCHRAAGLLFLTGTAGTLSVGRCHSYLQRQ